MEFEDLFFWADRYVDNAVEVIAFQAFAEVADAFERWGWRVWGFSEAGHIQRYLVSAELVSCLVSRMPYLVSGILNIYAHWRYLSCSIDT